MSIQYHRGYRITFEHPPIPRREWDWCAIDDNEEPPRRVAHGHTLVECIRSLDHYIEHERDE